ncbi:hypothetical protein [Paludibacterium yongneupense]|uniref:hypothetical protein n=1 Tax=Paludibacterium yongneupense TaxID=400061 RepID=UPI000414D9E5|nr:hypothetical protein [Paludibacterium yongneupense]
MSFRIASKTVSHDSPWFSFKGDGEIQAYVLGMQEFSIRFKPGDYAIAKLELNIVDVAAGAGSIRGSVNCTVLDTAGNSQLHEAHATVNLIAWCGADPDRVKLEYLNPLHNGGWDVIDTGGDTPQWGATAMSGFVVGQYNGFGRDFGVLTAAAAFHQAQGSSEARVTGTVGLHGRPSAGGALCSVYPFYLVSAEKHDTLAQPLHYSTNTTARYSRSMALPAGHRLANAVPLIRGFTLASSDNRRRAEGIQVGTPAAQACGDEVVFPHGSFVRIWDSAGEFSDTEHSALDVLLLATLR